MAAYAQVATPDRTRPCRVCDNHMELTKVETFPWAPRTAGERLMFRCAKCGMVQSEWNAVPMILSPGAALVPE
jgi:hypothetical protein